ncbi:site-specific integrase [Ruminococcus sp. NK3A76]|uniref:tyrosine-type recombinase/integrase n=1 Tax=Ruminococcus sp. NK3A76 TaxID=877411 RepID=UPI00048D864E|nr:site-specific integrase [Ruminococcus sp. NK3A76]
MLSQRIYSGLSQLGHLKLTAIKPIHIQNFIKYLSESECVFVFKNGETKKQGKKPSASTVRRYLAIVQSILNQAVKLEIIPYNPAKAEKLTIPKAATPKVEIFTKQEAAQMLECLEDEPLQFKVLVQLAIMTGARRGELVALKFSDIDYNTGRITIERAAVKLTGQPITTKPPKDYEVRSVVVPTECIELIQELKTEKEQEAEKLGDQWIEGGWIFTQWNGEIMNPMTPTKWFEKFLAKNGLKHRKFHSLRHTSATLLLYGGASIKQVQGRLGHGDIETTNKYLHYIAEADSESANILQNMLITHKTNDISDKEVKQA